MTLKVLVVDDASFVRDMVKRTLRQLVQGVILYEAPDGAKAVSIIKSKSPDLIFSDWEMPEMSGDELLKWVRADPKFKHIPFVMITSRGDRENVIGAVQAGVNDYLSKPFTAEELTNKINKQLKRIGYKGKSPPSPQSGAFGSLDALTAGRSDISINKGKKAGKPAPAKKTNTPNFKGKVFFRFAKDASECALRELSLQAVAGTIARPDTPPALFEQVSVDLINEAGEALARLNAYVHSVSAAEPNPNTQLLRVIVRFVDKDPAKMELLSSLISG